MEDQKSGDPKTEKPCWMAGWVDRMALRILADREHGFVKFITRRSAKNILFNII